MLHTEKDISKVFESEATFCHVKNSIICMKNGLYDIETKKFIDIDSNMDFYHYYDEYDEKYFFDLNFHNVFRDKNDIYIFYQVKSTDIYINYLTWLDVSTKMIKINKNVFISQGNISVKKMGNKIYFCNKKKTTIFNKKIGDLKTLDFIIDFNIIYEEKYVVIKSPENIKPQYDAVYDLDKGEKISRYFFEENITKISDEYIFTEGIDNKLSIYKLKDPHITREYLLPCGHNIKCQRCSE